ncbi:MAG: LPS export ABC transporter periplasmic protein LptC [Deltaproteobacteria bacterium]|jgi:LPS export ABC transporter protein LptC|nr:MAG: LPS export ABC transporter periplasmic protein LptC [Deltaproteobacteria bacterium]
MKRTTIILCPIIGILLVLMVVAFFLFKVPRLAMVSSKTPNLIPGESLKISDIEYGQDYKNGEGKWKLKAKEGHFFDKTQIVTLKDVLLKLDSFKENSFTIKGNEGDYIRESGEIILRGDVIGSSTNGYQIETSLLIYRQKDESVETDKPIRVIGPFFHIKGDGLYIDLKKKTFTVKGNVFTTFTNGDFL